MNLQRREFIGALATVLAIPRLFASPRLAQPVARTRTWMMTVERDGKWYVRPKCPIPDNEILVGYIEAPASVTVVEMKRAIGYAYMNG